MDKLDRWALDDSTPLYQSIVQHVRARIAAGALLPGDRLPPTRQLAHALGVNANTVAHAYSLLEAEGVLEGKPGRGTFIAGDDVVKTLAFARDDQLRGLVQRVLDEAFTLGYSPTAVRAAFESSLMSRTSGETQLSLLFQGSHDPALEVLWALAARTRPGFHVQSASVGSLWGLVALERGDAQLAGAHLFDPESGKYNLPWIRRILPGRSLALLHMAGREQGLLHRDGEFRSLRDIARPGVRFINRQRGSGTRILLDHHLAQLGLSPDEINGYEREESTHSAVAVAVAGGGADVGLGTYSAAKTLGLRFAPIATEQYDLVVLADQLQSDGIQAVVEALRSPEFRAVLEASGGYDTSLTGELRLVRPSI